MPKWFVYLIECVGGSLYCGITKDVDERIRVHNSGKGAKYTRGKGPVKLLYWEECEGHESAAKREAQIKKWSRHLKANLIRSQNPDFKLKEEPK